MCIRTDEEYDLMFAKLPDQPCGLIEYQKEEKFYTLIQWETIAGRMESKELLDHSSCGIFHTRFDPHTEVGWHNHGKDSVETIVCLEGEITILFSNKKTVKLKENERLDIPANIAHMAIIGDKPTQIIAITVPKEKKHSKIE